MNSRGTSERKERGVAASVWVSEVRGLPGAGREEGWMGRGGVTRSVVGLHRRGLSQAGLGAGGLCWGPMGKVCLGLGSDGARSSPWVLGPADTSLKQLWRLEQADAAGERSKSRGLLCPAQERETGNVSGSRTAGCLVGALEPCPDPPSVAQRCPMGWRGGGSLSALHGRLRRARRGCWAGRSDGFRRLVPGAGGQRAVQTKSQQLPTITALCSSGGP